MFRSIHLSRLVFAGRSAVVFGLLLQSGMAHALSPACKALNEASGSVSYTNRWLAEDFAPGESLSVSFYDNGDGLGGNPVMSDGVRLTSRNIARTAYAYQSNTGSKGVHAGYVSAAELSNYGLMIRIKAGTYMGPIALTCVDATHDGT